MPTRPVTSSLVTTRTFVCMCSYSFTPPPPCSWWDYYFLHWVSSFACKSSTGDLNQVQFHAVWGTNTELQQRLPKRVMWKSRHLLFRWFGMHSSIGEIKPSSKMEIKHVIQHFQRKYTFEKLTTLEYPLVCVFWDHSCLKMRLKQYLICLFCGYFATSPEIRNVVLLSPDICDPLWNSQSPFFLFGYKYLH